MAMGKALRPVLTIFALAACFCRAAPAVPALQLYSPQAEYNTATESWFTEERTFELWVAGARSPELIHKIEQVKLYVAVPGYGEDWDWAASGMAPSLTISSTVSSEPPAPVNPDKNPLAPWTVTLDADDLGYGRPDTFDEFSGGGLPWHGIYPAWYWTVDLAAYTGAPGGLDPELKYAGGDSPVLLDVDDPGEKAYDFNQDFDPTDPEAGGMDRYGDVQYYHVSYEPYRPEIALHFDAVGFATNGWTRWVNAPYSHDADAASTPEPTTLVLGLLGLAGCAAAAWRRRGAGR